MSVKLLESLTKSRRIETARKSKNDGSHGENTGSIPVGVTSGSQVTDLAVLDLAFAYGRVD